jgi:hypothetical protein
MLWEMAELCFSGKCFASDRLNCGESTFLLFGSHCYMTIAMV